METSKDLLYVNPDNDCSPFLINTNKQCKEASKPTQPPKITKIEASSLLNRARSFIPLLATANEQLAKDMKLQSADHFNIEKIDEDRKFIEMNIGIFAKETDSGTSSSDECDSESGDDDLLAAMIGGITEDNFKISSDQKQNPNLITEIDCKDINENCNNDAATGSLSAKSRSTVVKKVPKLSNNKMRKKKRKNGKHTKF